MYAGEESWVAQRIDAARGGTPALPENTVDKFRELLCAELQQKELTAKARNDLATALLETLIAGSKTGNQ